MGRININTRGSSDVASSTKDGLMSANDKSKLDGITDSADAVSFSRSLNTGTKIGTLTINGTAIDLYCNNDTNTTYGVVTTSANGLMSASDKSKLDGITASADSVAFSQSLTSGTKLGTITINGTGIDLYCNSHPVFTAVTGVPGGNVSPAFGGTFSVNQVSRDANGHVSAITSRTITIPSTAASTSAAGLVTTGAQTFAGAKTFNGGAIIGNTPDAASVVVRNIRSVASASVSSITTSNLPAGSICFVY